MLRITLGLELMVKAMKYVIYVFNISETSFTLFLDLLVCFFIVISNRWMAPCIVLTNISPSLFCVCVCVCVFNWLEANYFTTFLWVLSYIDMNQPWSYMYSPSRSPLPPPSTFPLLFGLYLSLHKVYF